MFISCFLCCCEKNPEKNNLRRERSIYNLQLEGVEHSVGGGGWGVGSHNLRWVITLIHSQGAEEEYSWLARVLFIQSCTPTHEVVPSTVRSTLPTSVALL